MKLDAQARGVYPIAATPFHPDGRIDGRSVDALVDFYQSAGADGLTILGVLGEAPKVGADGNSRTFDDLPDKTNRADAVTFLASDRAAYITGSVNGERRRGV
jgi:dihydrodipicolinate synthase/N-acetylneuraminate lyase